MSFASIYINPDYMNHLIKRGLGSLKCRAWVALVFGFNLVCLGRVAKTLLQKSFKKRHKNLTNLQGGKGVKDFMTTLLPVLVH